MIAEAASSASLWVAGASLLVAAIALGFSMYSVLRVDRAALAAAVEIVTLTDDPVLEDATVLGDVVQVSVVNVGKRPLHLKALSLYIGKRRWRWYYKRLPKRIQTSWAPYSILMPPEDGLLHDLQRGYEESQPIPGRFEVGSEAVVIYGLSDVVKSMETDLKSYRAAYASASGSTDASQSKVLSYKKLRTSLEKSSSGERCGEL